MPRLTITNGYSHMFGEAVLDRLYPELKDEVTRVITMTPVAAATKRRREKTKQGRTIWSGKDFNESRSTIQTARLGEEEDLLPDAG